ncbi:MAG TPA: DNA translocase FtsK 4TM domain-containing protein [Myxococcota bacterium]|nr:DNA translocase FtsK 4TM domain-containing protein [Myxococcota bacterium]
MGGRRSPRAKGAEPRLPGRLEAEAVAVTFAALALFAEASLISYAPSDPLFAHGARVENWCGPAGAFTAGVLAGTLGFAAHLLPLALGVVAWRYLRGLPIRSRWIPLAGWALCLLAMSGACEVLHRLFPDAVSAHAGGVLGGLVVAPLARAFYLTGTSFLLVIALALGLIAGTGMSLRDGGATLRRGARALGRELGQLVRVSFARLRRSLEARAAAREDARVEAELAARDEPEAEAGHAAGHEPRPPRVTPPRRPKSGEPEVVEHRVPAPAPLRQESLPFANARGEGPYKLPDLDLLARGPESSPNLDRDALIRNSQILEKKLADFSVLGRVVKVHPGPVITMYEFEPAPGVKVSRIVNLSDDLALALRAISVRIVAPIPGKNVVGIEVPNVERDVVVLRDVVAHASFQETEARIPIALGKDIFGNPLTTDLASMPHLLVAGATGTGKSVFLNALLCSVLMRATPDDVKLLLVDPKMLEFSLYQGIPHLIAEVVTNPKRAAAALLGVVGKMEERYRLMAQKGVRNIEQYNKAIAKDLAANRPKPDDEIVPKKLPYIVVVIDELADLMIVAARDVEESLMRLAQMARAAGIHLVLATQRPSVDVLTGIIKANFPSRISFQVSSRTDSRTVLDANGAERLLGQGDLLHVPPGSSKLERIHGPYISEKEVQAVTEWVRTQGSPEFDPELIRLHEDAEKTEERGEELDELFDQAVEIVSRHRIASISFVQRKLKIGYNRSARILEQMENERIVGPQEGTKPREIFVRPPEE